MDYDNSYSYYQDPFVCCPNQQQFYGEPLIPASVPAVNNFNRRQSTKPMKKSCLTDSKPPRAGRRKSEKMSMNAQQSLVEAEKTNKELVVSSKKRSTMKRPTVQKDRNSIASHPSDCGCADCDKREDFDDDEANDNCDDVKPLQKESKSKMSKHSSVVTIANHQSSESEKCLEETTLYNASGLRESKTKNSTIGDDESDSEIWLFHCPRNYDPRKMLCNEFSKKEKLVKVDCSVERFNGKKTLVFISPEKAAEYELICENVKLVKPIGNIVVVSGKPMSKEDSRSQKKLIAVDSHHSFRSQSQSGVSQCETDVESVEEQCEDLGENLNSDHKVKPLGAKKLSKKLNDQRFTIETTVTVQKIGDRKSKKSGILDESCLSFVPPEPSPMKQKKKSKRDTMMK